MAAASMSALCQERHLAPQQTTSLFDHFVGEREYASRKFETERPGSLETDDEPQLGRLLDRKSGRLGTLQNPVGVDGSTPMEIRNIYVIGHEATAVSDLIE